MCLDILFPSPARTPKEGNPDDTLVEMKTDKRNEQTGLLSPGGGGGGGPNEVRKRVDV